MVRVTHHAREPAPREAQGREPFESAADYCRIGASQCLDPLSRQRLSPIHRTPAERL